MWIRRAPAPLFVIASPRGLAFGEPKDKLPEAISHRTHSGSRLLRGATHPSQGRQRERRLPALLAYVSFTFFSGRLRTGLPVAAWMALSTAGVLTLMVGSPTPPQKSKVGTITVSTFGISARRRIW